MIYGISIQRENRRVRGLREWPGKRDADNKPTVETKKDNSGWVLAVVIIFAINFLAQLLSAL